MPSNTARSGGTIYPIIKNIPEVFGSKPGETARKMGSYIMWTALATTAVFSSLFLTANAPNLLGLELVRRAGRIHSSSWSPRRRSDPRGGSAMSATTAMSRRPGNFDQRPKLSGSVILMRTHLLTSR